MMKSVKKTLSIIVIMALLVTSLSMPALASETVTAAPTVSPVLVNGTAVAFQAYNIGGNNYFKLRDLAMALNGSAKQFEIGYDSINNAISISTGKAYTAVGDELTSAGNASSKQATVSTAAVYIDGTKAALSAYTIGGNNYFKLRDIAAAINFGVTYNKDTDTIAIDSSKGYISDTNPIIGTWRFTIKMSDAEYISYLIFSVDGTITQYIGNQIATYRVVNEHIFVTALQDGATLMHNYNVTSANGQTTLNKEGNAFGEMVREGETTDTGAGAIIGIWLSKNEIYKDISTYDTYFNFSKDGGVYVGIEMTGTYTVSASGDSFTDIMPLDASPETCSFKIVEENGITKLIVTDSEGNETVMYKE